MSAKDNDALLLAVKNDDIRAVKEIIQSHPGTLRVNEGRGVLQWLDCGGAVHSQVTLSVALVAEL